MKRVQQEGMDLTKHKGGVGAALHTLIFMSTSALLRH